MPRAARVKSSDSIYHVMVRSVGGTLLFESDTDKNKYLSLVSIKMLRSSHCTVINLNLNLPYIRKVL